MTIQVSNIEPRWKNEDLKKLFEPFGEVASAEVAIDVFTNRSRCFGLVVMPNEAEATAAIAALHQSSFEDLQLQVQEAEPQPSRKGSYKVGNGAVNAFPFRKK